MIEKRFCIVFYVLQYILTLDDFPLRITGSMERITTRGEEEEVLSKAKEPATIACG